MYEGVDFMKAKKPSLEELIEENKEDLLKDKKALEEIEKRIEKKAIEAKSFTKHN